MLVSYEKAMNDREAFVGHLADFCGVPLTPDLRKTTVSKMQNAPDSYINSARIMVEGHFDGVRDGVARGWARQISNPKTLSVEIRHNGKTIAKGMADQYREDLKKVNKHNGKCGFFIRLPRDLALDELEAVTVPYNVKLHKKAVRKKPD